MNPISKNTTLISLAMLKVHIDHNQDYLEYLSPFIRQILFKRKTEQITDSSIAEYIKQDFGLSVPPRPIQIVLKRLYNQRIISKQTGVYRIKSIDDPGIDQKKTVAERHINAVIKSFSDFCKNEENRNLTEDDVLTAIIDFLSEFTIPLLKMSLQGTLLPDLSKNKSEGNILVGKYLLELNKKDPERFGSFMILLEGNMLANGILCPDLAGAPKSYTKTTFFIDTPLLIELLGLAGEAKENSISELLKLLRNLKGSIGVFSHTRDELINVLENVARYIDTGDSRIIREAHRTGRTKSDFLLLAGKIPEELRKHKIQIYETPVYSLSYQIDETAFEGVLDDEINYHHEQAKRNDINSVRSIYELRKNTTPENLEKARGVLVTNNAAFSKAAYMFGKNYQESKSVSSVITDFNLANIAWLKAPMSAPTLPTKEVIAYSYAALRPTKELLNKYLKQVETLLLRGDISQRNHQLLRSSRLVDEKLMTLTLGNESALSNETPHEILKRITDEIKQEENEKYIKEKENHEKTQVSKDEALKQLNIIKEKIFWEAESRSNILYKVLLILFSAIAGLSYVSFFIETQIKVFDIIVKAATVILSSFYVFNLFRGTAMKTAIKKIVSNYFKHCYTRKMKKLGIDSTK